MKNTEQDLKEFVIHTLKSEMGRTLTKPADLSEKLNLSAHMLRKKINRGSFSATFFIHALQALGVTELKIPSKN